MVFVLSSEFLGVFRRRRPRFGPLGEVTFLRTYARPFVGGGVESFFDCCRRVVEGVFEVQRLHCLSRRLPWDSRRAQRSAQRMFELMWEFKFLPPGRGLWMMGSDYVSRAGSAALNNCAFVSTENLFVEWPEPFCFLMDMSMLGVGVGADLKGSGRVRIVVPEVSDVPFVVVDSREGWVDLVRVVLNSFVGRGRLPSVIDVSGVRPAGAPIVGFGGTASGPVPLLELVDDIKRVLTPFAGKVISSGAIVDLFNVIGKCVVAGNVRRTAEIMFGSPDDVEFLDLKNPELHNDELLSHRWASNNSVFASVGMDYSVVAGRTAKNGEPGYEWLENAQAYGRLCDGVNNKDYRVRGGNPCLEQSLEPYELCNLVETFPSNHDSLAEWVETLKYAYLYAKSVTLIPTHYERTNEVMNRNRRIGCSVSGITQAFKKFGRRNVFRAMDEGYRALEGWDRVYSEWLGIPLSIKMTSIKPSGTVSLLAGVTPGIHYPVSEYYVRNIRFAKDSPLVSELKDKGYKVEPCKYSKSSMVVSFPVREEYFDRSVDQVSLWEQLENVEQVQRYWADNQVSVTVTFGPDEASQIKYALECFEDRLKGCSFLPRTSHGYVQAPYIPISKEEYEVMVSVIDTKKLKNAEHELVDEFCDGGKCEVSLPL